MKVISNFCVFLLAVAACGAQAQTAPRVVDLPTRAGVTQRFLLIAPAQPRAAAILFAGGNGWVNIFPNGSIGALGGNFLVRTRDLFVEQGMAVAVIDAPSDRQGGNALGGFRASAEHVEDVKAVIARMRDDYKVPVWLIGTSRGTESAAFVATRLPRQAGGADGIVLTSTILADKRVLAVPAMDVDTIAVPVLVVHHRRDDCFVTRFEQVPSLMDKLTGAPRKDLLVFDGGENAGDPCGARAYHGYNGLERVVVAKITEWMTQ